MISRIAIRLVVAVALVASALVATSAPASASDIEVATTASPLFDVVTAVGGSRVHAVDLVPLDMYGPVSERNAKQLAKAKLVVMMMDGQQPLVDQAMKTTGSTAAKLPVLGMFPPETRVGAFDTPYVWQDPANMIAIAQRVGTTFTQMDPDGAGTYRKNLKHFTQLMADVERINERDLATCKRHQILVTNPTFDYYIQRFGLQQIPVDESNLNTVVADTDATTVFSPALAPFETAKTRNADLGIRSAVLDPMSNRTDQLRRGGANYATVMGINLDALRYALDCDDVGLSKS